MLRGFRNLNMRRRRRVHLRPDVLQRVGDEGKDGDGQRPVGQRIEDLGPFQSDPKTMCGIVGYVGNRNATDVILEALRRLEYRGYDSAGLAVLSGQGLELRRHPGKIRVLEALLHTRLAEGHRFRSETDTEVIAHLVESQLKTGTNVLAATKAALSEVRGAYALAILSSAEPDRVVAAKHGAGAVVVGLGDGEAYLASDFAAILPYTREVIVLEDDEVAVLTRGGARSPDSTGERSNGHPRGWPGTPPWPRRAATRTSCSRRSTSSHAR